MLIGHLINPQVCGMALSEVRMMNIADAHFVLDAVGMSAKVLEKARPKG